MGTVWDIAPAWQRSPAETSEHEKLAAARLRVQARANLSYVKAAPVRYVKAVAIRAFLRAGRTRWQAR